MLHKFMKNRGIYCNVINGFNWAKEWENTSTHSVFLADLFSTFDL